MAAYVRGDVLYQTHNPKVFFQVLATYKSLAGTWYAVRVVHGGHFNDQVAIGDSPYLRFVRHANLP